MSEVVVIAPENWWKLPLAVRQRWWRETDYGKRPPSPELAEQLQRLRVEKTATSADTSKNGATIAMVGLKPDQAPVEGSALWVEDGA